ncbi:glutamate--tRNA ligase [Candidatus Hodarchaeum mangrovi]
MNDEEIVEIQTLLNAVKYNGKAALNSTLGSIIQLDPLRFKPKIRDIKTMVEKQIELVNSMTLEDQITRLKQLDPSLLKEEKREKREIQIELPNLERFKEVVLRLAPYPSGPLHIGNSRMVVLNDYLAKKYKGKLLLVFDDTIGSETKIIDSNAYDLIPEGLNYLGIKINNIYYKSDRLNLFYKYARDIIQRGKAYVCTCEGVEWRSRYKNEKLECPCRNISTDVNLDRWEKMMDGTYQERAAVVRLKTGMNLPDPALRDPVMLRISEREHPRVGGKYRVWPLLEFSWGIDDHELGISHIIRGKDLRKEGDIEKMIWDIYGWTKPSISLYGRMRLVDIKLSKSNTAQLINKGIYENWKDPRTWSLQSLQRRGIEAEALYQALLELGMNPVDVTFSPLQIYSINRARIDAKVHRYFFVYNPVILTLKDLPEQYNVAKPLLHPEYPKLGTRTIPLDIINGECSVYISEEDITSSYESLLRLKDLVNITLEREKSLPKKIIVKGKKQAFETKKLIGRFHSIDVQNAREHHAIMAQWVPVSNAIPVKILMTDGTYVLGYGEPDLNKTLPGQVIQFERYAFCRIEKIGKQIQAIWTHR